jgi:hypothetical protein
MLIPSIPNQKLNRSNIQLFFVDWDGDDSSNNDIGRMTLALLVSSDVIDIVSSSRKDMRKGTVIMALWRARGFHRLPRAASIPVSPQILCWARQT